MSQDTELEMNWEKNITGQGYSCDKCNQGAIMECEVNVDRRVCHAKRWGIYCKEHYDSLFADLIDDMDDSVICEVDDLDD